MNTDRMMEVICAEIDKIADKGLTTSNIETAYKLVDMYKDLKTVEGMEDYDYSQRGRKRDSMGRYSRNYDDGNSYNYESRYMQAKRAYRADHSSASKANMLEAVDEYMDDMHSRLKEMKRDADTPEERDMIDKYIKMIERA